VVSLFVGFEVFDIDSLSNNLKRLRHVLDCCRKTFAIIRIEIPFSESSVDIQYLREMERKIWCLPIYRISPQITEIRPYVNSMINILQNYEPGRHSPLNIHARTRQFLMSKFCDSDPSSQIGFDKMECLIGSLFIAGENIKVLFLQVKIIVGVL